MREALVNLLVHADYAVREASLIVRTPSSFFFRNPGSSRVSEFDLLHGDRSDPRNPELVRMFRLIGLAEEAGTGMPKIIRAWRQLGMEMPTIDTGTERYEFTLRLRQAHLLSSEDRRWLRRLNTEWSEAEQLALVHAKHNGHVDNATLSRLSGMHPADITKVLIGLRDQDFLQKVSSGRYARYELGSRAITGRSIPNTANRRRKSVETDSPDLWNELLKIGAPIRAQRSVKITLIQLAVVSLCSRTPLSSRELAKLLGRKPRYLGSKVLSPLVASGMLGYLYPETPMHSFQKYMITPSASTEMLDRGNNLTEKTELGELSVEGPHLQSDPNPLLF